MSMSSLRKHAWLLGNSFLHVVLVVCCCSQIAIAADPASVELIEPDRPMPEIVIDSRATPPEKFAAYELRDALQKMTGRQIALRTDHWIKSTPERLFITVGKNRFTEDLNTGQLATEQYLIDVTPRRVAIVGGPDRQRGATYGVHELLNQLGVRWYRPEAWGEHVPKRDSVTLPVGRQISRQPDYRYRSVVAGGFTRQAEATVDQFASAALWGLRHHMNGSDPGSDPRGGGQVNLRFDHIYYQLVPVEEYFDKHPDFFCLFKGERRRKNPDAVVRPDNPTGLQLCLSNPELQELFAQKIIEQARGRRDLDQHSFSMTPNDACPFCECDACKAMDDPANPTSMSNRVCEFTNIVARKVAHVVPGARLSLNAYSTWTEPPTVVKRMEPNVLIHIALINGWSDYTKKLDASEPYNWNSTTAKSFQHWKELGVSEIYTYEYWSGYGWPGPLPIVHTIADRLKNYRQYNVRGVYNETHPSWGPQGLELYMYSKLIWNPDLDVDQELDLYYRNYYGPAYQPMKAYHEAWIQALQKHPYPVYSGGRGMHLLTKPKLIAETAKYLDEARQQVRGEPIYEERLKGVAAGHAFASGISQILTLKKKTGVKTLIPGTRGTYLKSEPAEKAFTEFLTKLAREYSGEPIFDMQAAAPHFWYLDGDVLRNDALGFEHEENLLSEF